MMNDLSFMRCQLHTLPYAQIYRKTYIPSHWYDTDGSTKADLNLIEAAIWMDDREAKRFRATLPNSVTMILVGKAMMRIKSR